MIVIDCSVLIAGTAEDETSVVADGILEKLESLELEAIVPSIFFLEVTNVLVSNLRRKRIDTTDLKKYTELFSILPIKQDHSGKMEDIISLAVEHGLSAYDAAYIELAERHNYPLATLDTKLHKAAKSCGIAYDVGFH